MELISSLKVNASFIICCLEISWFGIIYAGAVDGGVCADYLCASDVWMGPSRLSCAWVGLLHRFVAISCTFHVKSKPFSTNFICISFSRRPIKHKPKTSTMTWIQSTFSIWINSFQGDKFLIAPSCWAIAAKRWNKTEEMRFSASSSKSELS